MKKYAPYILILLILVGLLSPALGVKNAQAGVVGDVAKTAANIVLPGSGTAIDISGQVIESAVEKLMHIFFFTIPSFFFWFVGNTLNLVMYIALGGDLYNGTFVLHAWTVVRDFSNIFFIIILLYIAIQMILDLGGSESKKMIARVIILAMLINFSMFFTNIVIDSSNILALIFYNKIGTLVKTDNAANNYEQVSGNKEEVDIAGGLVGNFNPTKIAGDGGLFQKVKNLTFKGALLSQNISNAILITLSLLSLGFAYFGIAIFVFLLIVLAFMNRIVRLIFLLMFSPFAFMSFSVPFLRKIKFIGWDNWLEELIKNAFFAPIFTFFLFFIFMFIKEVLLKTGGILGLTTSSGDNSIVGFLRTLSEISIGFNLVMLMLWVAIKYAYKQSGKAGELLVAGAKLAGTVALAVATEGASLAATSTIGAGAAKIAGSEGLKQTAAKGGLGGFLAKKTLAAADYTSKASFDIKKMPGASNLAGVAGLKLREPPKMLGALLGQYGIGSAEGGYRGREERAAKATKEEAALLKTTPAAEKEAQAIYNEEKNNKKAKAAPGGFKTAADEKVWEEDYEKNNPKPTAISMDRDKMKAYKESLGQNPLLSAGIGAAGREKFLSGLEKEEKEMKKITDRLAENEKALSNIHGLLEDGRGKGLASGDKETGFTVDTEKIEERLATLVRIGREADLRLAEGIRSGIDEKGNSEAERNFHTKMEGIRTTMFESTVETGRLNKLKTAAKEERDLKKVIYDLGKDKSTLEKEREAAAKPKKDDKKEDDHGAPKAEPKHAEPARPAPAAPHPTPPPSGGGGGGDGGHGSGH